MAKKRQDEKPAPAPKLKYTVVAEFWDGPHLKRVGDTVLKTEDEAKYRVPHILELEATAAKSGSQPAPKSKR